MNIIKRYRFSLTFVAIIIIFLFARPELGLEMITRTGNSFREMLSVLPPIFILLGVLEVWVPREVIMRNLGEDSGLRGMLLSILMGAAAAGPLYVAFPVGVTMLKKGARYTNVAIFLFSWSTLKIPLILFETAALGWQITALRAAINLPAIVLLAHLTDRLLPAQEKLAMREKIAQAEMNEHRGKEGEK
ncbi:MAG: permease [Firmicutes bacterium]|nr:permease [Bacillota bacterium]